MNAVCLRAVAHSGNTAPRDKPAHDAAVLATSSVTIATCLSCKHWVRHACVHSWRTFAEHVSKGGNRERPGQSGDATSRRNDEEVRFGKERISTGKIMQSCRKTRSNLVRLRRIFPPRGAGACLFSERACFLASELGGGRPKRRFHLSRGGGGGTHHDTRHGVDNRITVTG